MKIPFSKRELEIVSYLIQGMTSKEIAAALFLSNHTIDTHRRNILRKAEAKNTPQLVYQLKSAGFNGAVEQLESKE